MTPEEFEHDLERMAKNDEELRSIETFWRRYFLFLVGLVFGLTYFVIAAE